MPLRVLPARPVRRCVVVAVAEGTELQRVVEGGGGGLSADGERRVRTYLVYICI